MVPIEFAVRRAEGPFARVSFCGDLLLKGCPRTGPPGFSLELGVLPRVYQIAECRSQPSQVVPEQLLQLAPGGRSKFILASQTNGSASEAGDGSIVKARESRLGTEFSAE